MKLTRFKDIPKMTSWGNYKTDMSIDYVVDHILGDWVDTHGLDLNPDFQRVHRWKRKDQTRWLEFILKGGQSGNHLFFNHPYWMDFTRDDDFVIVDGKQRLEACRAFIMNEVRVFGSYYREYKDRIPFMECCLAIHVNNLKTRKEVLKWYLDLNEGGVRHTRTELAKVRELYDIEVRKETP
jgi:hypothetical protein